MQKEIITKGNLLDETGRLKDAGWARSLIRTYQRERVHANHLRIKEWDYYLITDGHRGLALTIADNSYMGMYSVSWLDFDQPAETTRSVMKPLTLGKTLLPSTSKIGNVSYQDKQLQISFQNDGSRRILTCTFPKFKDNKTLQAHVTLTNEPKESMVIMTPYKEDPDAFYYNQKINCMQADGFVRLGTEYYYFNEDACGVLDWGRGVWTYANTWYWSSASGYVDGHFFGFNLGYGFGDTSNASENVLFYDGRIHKLGQIVFEIPQKDGKDDFLSPWKFTSNDNRFTCDFVPVIDRASCTNVGIIESDQHQVFGRFTGIAVLDDGTEIQLQDFFGFAEKVKNRW